MLLFFFLLILIEIFFSKRATDLIFRRLVSKDLSIDSDIANVSNLWKD